MGKEKGGFLTPKAISNRIKAKGLQKLRWYCQMCEKQCRDENGFKCHCMSETHQRQLLLFAEDPNKYLDSFSKDFFDDFMYLLKRRFGTKRQQANKVYQEYVSNRDHYHMNATQWETLTEFVKWLGREGHCVVDETPKGWFITYIDKDPEVIARQKAAMSKDKHAMDDQERFAKIIEKQVEKGKQNAEGSEASSSSTYTELQRTDDSEKVQLSFSSTAVAGSSKSSSEQTTESAPKKLSDLMKKKPDANAAKAFKDKSKTKRKSALEEILEEEEEARKGKSARRDNWLTPGIVVKIVTKKLGDKYHKKKCSVTKVDNLFIAVCEVQGTGDTLKLDQSHLQTVLPAIGKPVKVVNGQHRGVVAEMVSIDEKKFCASVKVTQGPLRGQTFKLPYEDICKLQQRER